MIQKENLEKIPGITMEDEKKNLSEILEITEQNLTKAKATVKILEDELHSINEVYSIEDKEGQAQWFNADARYKEAGFELLRAMRSRNKPYFGRIDFTDEELKKPECYYIGKAVIAMDAAKPRVIDWRAPIASVYYEKALGKCSYHVAEEGDFMIELSRKRTYEIEKDELKEFYDSDVVANDELLTKYLAKNKRAVLSEIIATIQQEQNEIIRKNPHHNMIIQGSAGSGKTTVAMHRISYILYNYELEFKPKDFYIIGSNKILLNYITGILPDLDVYGVSQMTMEELFTRLLYEEGERKFTIRHLDRMDHASAMKGKFTWFHDLERFCRKQEYRLISRENIVTDKTNRLLMSGKEIDKVISRFCDAPLIYKLDKLTEYLTAKVENEIYGRYYSYPKEEQKRLLRIYQVYFKKLKIQETVFELYHEFLLEQNADGKNVQIPVDQFDIYDLAALSYLYKRLKETEVIQEASHVVIDEAQDFGMMVYACLKYSLSKCTYTIMGDVSQNIYFEYGLSDWEELKELMLPEPFDYFGLLRKSYRNTVEISNFATEILHHGHFQVYPVEPIVRHGKEVHIAACKDRQKLLDETLNIIQEWKNLQYETIAVICKDEKEAEKVSAELAKKIEIRRFDSNTEEFGKSVMVLPIEFSKGLEFDTVLLFDAGKENYPAEDGYVKLLYVAATRALHELAVLYTDELTELISVPVPKEKRQKVIIVKAKPEPAAEEEEKPKTKREIELQRAKEGHLEMAYRDRIGPKRIVVQGKNSGVGEKAQGSRIVIGRKVDYYQTAGKNLAYAKPKQTNPVLKGESEYGSMPDTTSLRPAGHKALNMSIRWVTADKKGIDLTSACGTLRIMPITENTVRISFGQESLKNLRPIPKEMKEKPNVKWSYRDTKDLVEIKLEKLSVRADKRTGALTFLSSGGKELLSEAAKLPRQLGNSGKNQTWTYFDWIPKEGLKAYGEKEDWMELKTTARFISHGKNSEQAACIQSNKGYQLLVPAGVLTMCCTIPAYGSYLYTEGQKEIDYFFRSAI